MAEDDAVDPQPGLFTGLDPAFSPSVSGPSPPCSLPPPVETRDSGCGNELDEPTLSSRPPGPDLSPLRLLLPSRCLLSFLNLENESRMLSMSVSNRCR